jgi:hypothetical protein
LVFDHVCDGGQGKDEYDITAVARVSKRKLRSVNNEWSEQALDAAQKVRRGAERPPHRACNGYIQGPSLRPHRR